MNTKGLFVVIEGGEGTGKDVQVELLKNLYAGQDVVFTREPGGTEIGEKIREILLSKNSSKMSTETELLLFLGARAQIVREVVAPALCAGKMVISNRFGLSTVAYQIYGRERQQYAKFLQELSDVVVQASMPDLYILIDLDPKIGQARVAARTKENDRFDDEKVSFHNRVRQGYLESVKKTKKYSIINGDQSIEAIHKEIVAIIEEAKETIKVDSLGVCAMVN